MPAMPPGSVVLFQNRAQMLLAASSSVSQNIFQEALHLKLSQKASMLVARLTVIVIAILGVLIAQDPNSSVFGIVSFAWAGFGASLDDTYRLRRLKFIQNLLIWRF